MCWQPNAARGLSSLKTIFFGRIFKCRALKNLKRNGKCLIMVRGRQPTLIWLAFDWHRCQRTFRFAKSAIWRISVLWRDGPMERPFGQMEHPMEDKTTNGPSIGPMELPMDVQWKIKRPMDNGPSNGRPMELPFEQMYFFYCPVGQMELCNGTLHLLMERPMDDGMSFHLLKWNCPSHLPLEVTLEVRKKSNPLELPLETF